MALFIAAATILMASSSAAQTLQVEVLPAHPTPADDVSLVISPASGWIGAVGTRSGNHFRLDLQACPILCIPTLDIPLGPLPAGTYTYEIFDRGELLASGSFVVANVIPLLSPGALTVLSVLLGGAGLAILSRYNFL